MTVRTFDFGPEVEKLLTNLEQRNGMPKPEIIRRALALYDYLHKQTDNPEIPPVRVSLTQGNRILLTLDELP